MLTNSKAVVVLDPEGRWVRRVTISIPKAEWKVLERDKKTGLPTRYVLSPKKGVRVGIQVKKWITDKALAGKALLK